MLPVPELVKRQAHLSIEELRKKPENTNFHQNGVVPMALFHEAVESPIAFLESANPSQIGSEETAHSPSNGDQPMSTSSPSGKEAARRFGRYSEALMRDYYTDLMQEIDEEIKDRNKRVETLDESRTKKRAT
jgi:hypothetical protein